MEICGLDCSGSEQRRVLGAGECGNEPSGTIKYGDLLASQESLSCTQSWRQRERDRERERDSKQ